ncbi:hypothetical protein P7C71_g3640, partial [Lecanoromycetidae sp. Uapishka_2]
MPEISIEIAEREISRLTTMDFFMGVFSSENTDPLTIIESLEPLLDLSVKHQNFGNLILSNTAISSDAGAESASTVLGDGGPDSKLLEAMNFLEQGPLPLRLFLWQKLRDAYRSIGYPPQVLSCDLRILALIVNHLSSPSYIDNPDEIRRDGLLRWLHRIDDHMTRILGTAISKAEAFECVDCEHILPALESLASLQKILHVFASWEDTIRVGKTPQPVPVGSAATKGLVRSTDKFRDMIVKTWTFQYLLQKEAMKQYAELFATPDEDRIKQLEHMHQALGLRCYCHLANKTFLRLMKTELERCRDAENWETDMAQLVFDLYGVKISSNAVEMQDHFCPSEELDRRTALEILDLVMIQTNRKDIRDILKSDLKNTVERMQQVIRIPKLLGSTSRTFNSRLANNYLKSPINPYDLYRSLRGIGGLPGRDVHDEGSDVAAKGWYFLLGNMSLNKFTSQKRTAAGSIEDLEVARAFFRHDLEFNADRWESWYRLAKVFDTMIDEDATWSADKLDNHMDDLVVSQRKAIHCYSMALAVATRCAVANFEETDKIADLYADYGSRLYASSRDFVNHSGVWEEVCRAYLQLLRHQPNCIVPEGYSELMFQGMHPDTYQTRANRLETWMHSETTSPPIVDILREAIELKKLNNNLFKSNLFEDLIRDVYAHLYDSVVPNLIAQDAVEENRVRMSVDTILTYPAPSVETPPVDLSAAQAEQQKSRARWLTQRELVRRAEAIAAKPAPTVPAKMLKPLAPAPLSPQEQTGKPGSTPALAVVIDLDKDGTSSVPGSVHDSADDESELSEVDEEVVEVIESRLTDASGERPPLFPNLLRTKTDDGGDGDEAMGDVAEDEMVDERGNEVQHEETQSRESGVPQGNW